MKYMLASLLVAFVLVFGFQTTSFAAEDFEVSGWIPYWRASEGVRSARSNLDVLTEVRPFGVTVKNDGSLNDLFGFKKSSWTRFMKSAKSKDVLITPTIMTSNGALVHALLSDPELREEHIDHIVSFVKKGKYNGIDIDYEGKLAETKDYFSLFLKELSSELGSKRLSCTIEARTPPDSLYTTVPENIRYANDLAEIGKYCDRVTIMAYDQQRADIRLNAQKVGEPYIPVSDIEWVRKVIDLMTLSIPKEKMILALPTYGHEYALRVQPEWYQGYDRQWSLNPEYAIDLAKDLKITPSRNKAGELSFSYFATSSPYRILEKIPVPKGTPSGNIAAVQALLFANGTGGAVPVNYVTWSDAEAIKTKVQLAKELGLAGVSIFKIDGGEDKNLWDAF